MDNITTETSIDILSQGKNSLIFRATLINTDTNAKRHLILKTLVAKFTDQRHIERFRREFELGYLLRHSPHVITFLDYYDIYMEKSSNNKLNKQLTTPSPTTLLHGLETTNSNIHSCTNSNNNNEDNEKNETIPPQSTTTMDATMRDESHNTNNSSSNNDNNNNTQFDYIPSASDWLDKCNFFLLTSSQSSIHQQQQQSQQSQQSQYHSPRVTHIGVQQQYATAIIVMDDFGGESLTHSIPPTGFTITQFLPMAIQIVKMLDEMHRKNIMHHDIKPDNICINKQTNQLKIIDFSSAVQLREVNTRGLRLEGTLAYISPEQTGRNNRNVDYRSDFYMTGCTFYQMLLGRLPFVTTDFWSLIYSHLAIDPVPPREVSAQIHSLTENVIPHVLSDIVMKLLKKNPEDRYQSSAGLLYDLTKCQASWEQYHRIDPFQIAEHDISEKFIIRNAIYGREKELQLLSDAFERSRWSRVEVLTISGFSGIGKTTLVREVEKLVSLSRGYFISGKFDQYNRTSIHGAISDAFQALIKQILAESESVITEYRKDLIDALGVNRQLIINIIPELEKLIGKQEQLQDVDAIESKNRFTMVFQDFVSVFTKRCNIVLFIDDLQWADATSLSLLQVLLNSPDISNMLIIAAYRNNELTPSCLASVTLQEMRSNGTLVQEMTLNPLSYPDVHHWIKDTLSLTLEETKDLADFVYARCDGNPFFVKQLLQVLYDKELIFYHKGKWCYNIHNLNFPAADKIVNLMIHQLNQLPDSTMVLLQLASCLGNSFDLTKLELLSGQSSRSQLLHDLYPALNKGLVIVSRDTFCFAHDRVQDAVYSRFSFEERQQLHIKYARLLLESKDKGNETTTDLDQKNICEIANHFNQGKQLLMHERHCQSTLPDILRLTRINLQAGQIAKHGIAYSASIDYLLSGIEYFDFMGNFVDQWTQYYEIGFNLYKEIAEVYYLSSKYQDSEETLDFLLKNVRSDEETVELYNIRLVQLALLGDLKKAIDLGLMALELLGDKLPSDTCDITRAIQVENRAIGELLEKRIDNDVHNVPNLLQYRCSNVQRKKELALRTLTNLIPATYMWHSAQFNLVVLKSTRQSLEDGWMSDTPLSFAYFGVYLVNTNEREKQRIGYEFGKLALSLCETVGNGVMKCKVYTVVATKIMPWFCHIRRSEHYMNIGYNYGLESGELQFIGYGRSALGTIYYLRGEPINNIVSELEKMAKFSKRISNQMAIDSVRAEQLMMYHLMGRRYKEHANIQELFQENDRHLSETRALYAEGHWKIYKAILFYIYDQNIDLAFGLMSDVSDNYVQYMTSLPTLILQQFYESLIILKLLNDPEACSKFERSALLCQLDKIRNRIEHNAGNCPENFQNKLLVIDAERMRLEGDWRALDLYDESIELATVQGFTSEAAIASELAGVFLLQRKKPHLAKHYLKRASKIYEAWGATRKTEMLQASYRKWVPSLEYHPGDLLSSSSSVSTSSLSLALLDIDTVIRTSQIISSTIDMRQLLFNIMKIITENSGAETCALIVDNMIEALYKDQQIDTLCQIPISECDHFVCRSIVEYVSRTQETVIIHDASQDALQFKHHPYIERHKPKSILCMPIVRQQELKGLLYLENNLMCNAFTEQRYQILSFVVSQAAIALENARFFKAQMDAAEQIAQIQKKRAQEAEIYQQKQEDFIDRVCHEIRNPLSGVFVNLDVMKSVVDSLEEELSSSSMPKLVNKISVLRECMDSIDICTKHQKTIADDVLLLSKLDSSSPIPLYHAPFDVNRMLSTVVKMFQSQIDSAGLSLSVRYLQPDAIVVADMQRVKQVIINLLTNAIKYNVPNGEITVAVMLDRSKPALSFQIRDSGIGMTQSEMGQLFNRFKRLDHKTEFSGSGLGLVITKSLVELMGGSIHVTSEHGKGTCFQFSVVCELRDDEGAGAGGAGATGGCTQQAMRRIDSSPIITPDDTMVATSQPETSFHVLITEDNNINQKILKKSLEAIGYTCQVANNGSEACQLYEQDSSIQCILMDIRMPVMDGITAAINIRQREQETGRKPCVIIGLSGNARSEQVDAALASGMDEYLTKPVRTQDVVRVIEQLCHHSIDPATGNVINK